MSAAADSTAFRKALGAFATGVTIVTTCDEDGRDTGVTASSFNSVSLDPPLVLWSLAKTSSSFNAFSTAAYFAVHVLASDQQDLSIRFSKRGIDKFEGTLIKRGEGDIPLLDGCAARFQCRTAYRYDGGDHLIFVGEVVNFEHGECAPLVFHDGGYALAARRSLEEPPGSLAHLIQRCYFQLLTPVRRERERQGVSLHDHYVLSVLAASSGKTIEQVDDVVAYTGVRATAALASSLVDRGLLFVGDEETGALFLTDSGKKAVISLTGAAMAIEADVTRHLKSEQKAVLKDLLSTLVKAADPGGEMEVTRHMELLGQLTQELEREISPPRDALEN